MNPDKPSKSYKDFVHQLIKGIAVGMGLPEDFKGIAAGMGLPEDLVWTPQPLNLLNPSTSSIPWSDVNWTTGVWKNAFEIFPSEHLKGG